MSSQWCFSTEIRDIKNKMQSDKPIDQECPERLIYRRCKMRYLDPVISMTNLEIFIMLNEFDRRLCSGMNLRDNFIELDKYINKVKCRIVIEEHDLNYKETKKRKKK